MTRLKLPFLGGELNESLTKQEKYHLKTPPVPGNEKKGQNPYF